MNVSVYVCYKHLGTTYLRKHNYLSKSWMSELFDSTCHMLGAAFRVCVLQEICFSKTIKPLFL